MRAIVITRPGGPDVLKIAERPDPIPRPDEMLIEVKAFGLNRAELYFRSGAWGNSAEITGIECVGEVRRDLTGTFETGQKVIALMGGMGRTRNGSYAELTTVPASNVVAVESSLSWEELAALPESYATAWTCLLGNLELKEGQKVVLRGATSALGQAAVNIAAELGANVLATTRSTGNGQLLRMLGVTHVLAGEESTAANVRRLVPDGVDGVLDLVGISTLLDSLAMTRKGGHVCVAGFLGGGGGLEQFDPIFQMPGGVHLSAFASAFAFGTREFPLSAIPFQDIADKALNGDYQAKPAHVFAFEDIVSAHELMERNAAGGKLVIKM